MFSCEFCEIFKNTFFNRPPMAAASRNTSLLFLNFFYKTCLTWLIYLYEPPIFTIVFGFLVYKWLRVSFGMMGKLCITLSFNAFYIWSVELYPTVVRYISNSFGKSENITRILQWNLCLYLVFTKVPIINWNNKKKIISNVSVYWIGTNGFLNYLRSTIFSCLIMLLQSYLWALFSYKTVLFFFVYSF